MPTTSLTEKLRAIVGIQGYIDAPADMQPYTNDWRGIYEGKAAAVVRPASTEELSAVVTACAAAGTPIVPQGGNTGMCGASVPVGGGHEIVVSMGRMNRIRSVDPLNNTITVDAGCVLATIQDAAAAAGRLFPLSLGAQGSCQIGGNLSTNAGGTNVLRYGNTRDLVLGLEVVLADGRIWNGMRSLRKDNTGYDLKQLFVGSEGTLGIITGAVLKLFPQPAATSIAWLAVPHPDAALELLSALRARFGERISGFELISRRCLDLVLKHIPGSRDPLSQRHGWYVLSEVSDSDRNAPLRAGLEESLATLMEHGTVLDAAIPERTQQGLAFWHMRESIPEAARQETGMLYRHDVAVAVGRVPEFITEADAALKAAFPGVDILCFGHLGDGNLHYNAYVEGRARTDASARSATDVTDLIYDIVARYDGSFSAEHGIGLAKVSELKRYKSDVEIDLMRTLKRALDPTGLLNPGKVL